MEEEGFEDSSEFYITSFTDYQRKMWYSLSQGAVSRFYHARDKEGRYYIQKIGKIALTFYWIMWINTTIKVSYLLLTYNSWLGIEVHFLDQMSIWDWYLSTTHMVQEQIMWYPKYPMYEILYRQWDVQEDIYRKLGRPVDIAKKIHRTDRINTFYYPFVVFTGTFALSVQFFFTPKYALNTYAVIPDSWDSWWMQVIFCLHECLFMYHAYAYQACTMVVAESKATSFQHLLEEMTKTLYTLIDMGEERAYPAISDLDVELQSMGMDQRGFKPRARARARKSEGMGKRDSQNASGQGLGDPHGSEDVEVDAHGRPKRVKRSAYRRQIARDGSGVGSGVYRERPRRRYLDPHTKAPGTEYDIMTLISDYRKIMICSTEHNKWIGKLMGGAQAANYAQFVSDVFMMIQLLKEPDFDLFGISFYVMDACFGMCMLFRMLILLSRLVPASDEFLHGIKCYAMYETPLRKYIVKLIPTMRRVSAKLTGYSVRPQSVPTGVNVLINWYIAAMWKRPDDPTRRT